MNTVDSQYFAILSDILENGTFKKTRSGNVLSVFDRVMRFDLKEGLPLLTTKKVYTKGIIYELLWFLKGDSNIKYLIDNNVHIWDDDAYRHYLTKIAPLFNNSNYQIFDVNTQEEVALVIPRAKEEFIECVSKFPNKLQFKIYTPKQSLVYYKFGDLGPIYGKQWKRWGGYIDQVQYIIDMLKTNPDDRRMVLSAWNVGDLNFMALPPCHMFATFYTRELNAFERLEWLWENSNNEYDEWKCATHETLDKLNVPRRELSCSFTMRSNDFFLGNPYNIASYAILTHMIAQCVNMSVGELVYHGMDVHLYENHIDAAKEQLERDPCKYKLPKLVLNRNITDINQFTYEDITIKDYESYPSIKAPLSVGL